MKVFFWHFFPSEKSASVAGQVSAQLGGHVSSSTLGAHQMARARVAHSSPDGELTWVDDNNVTWMLLDRAHGLYWMNLATRHTQWHPGSACSGGASDPVHRLWWARVWSFARLRKNSTYFLREAGLRQFFLRALCVSPVYGCYWKNFEHSCLSPRTFGHYFHEPLAIDRWYSSLCNASFDSGFMFCISSRVAFGGISSIFFVKGNYNPEVDSCPALLVPSFHADWRSVHS